MLKKSQNTRNTVLGESAYDPPFSKILFCRYFLKTHENTDKSTSYTFMCKLFLDNFKRVKQCRMPEL